MSDDNTDVYYRLYRVKGGDVFVVCMQWFDELDYDQDRFVTENKYDDEDQADEALARWLNENGVTSDMMHLDKATDFARDLRMLARAYPEEVFIPPTKERLAAVHEWLISQGGTLDAISAHVMRTMAIPRYEEAAQTIEKLTAELNEAREAINELWGEMPADNVEWLMKTRPDVVNLCKRVHMRLWHPDQEGSDG